MTPMLILLFGVKPSTAISSDLVAAVGDRLGRSDAVSDTRDTVSASDRHA